MPLLSSRGGIFCLNYVTQMATRLFCCFISSSPHRAAAAAAASLLSGSLLSALPLGNIP